MKKNKLIQTQGFWRKGVLSSVLLGFAGLTTPVLGQAELPPEKVAPVESIEGEITIDGVADEADWSKSGTYVLDRLQGNEGEVPFEASWKGVYDPQAGYLYVFIDVVDDDLSTDSQEMDPPQTWHDDGIELQIDGDNSDSDSFDGVNDFKWLFLPQEDGTVTIIADGFPTNPNQDPSDISAMASVSDTGWTVELAIPFHLPGIVPKNNTLFGFDIAINDDDDGGDRESVLRWSTTGNVNQNPDQWGNIVLLETEKTALLPLARSGDFTVDGIADESDWGLSWEYVTDRMQTPGLDAPTQATWKGVFTEDNYLYIFIDVPDEDLVIDDQLEDIGNFWMDDNIEMFIDVGNTDGAGGNPFDGMSDWKWAFLPQPDGSVTIISDLYPPSPTTEIGDMEAAGTVTDSGYTVEIKIPMSLLGLTVKDDLAFGFDFSVGDDDDGGSRDSVSRWSSTGNMNQAPDTWGNVRLAAPRVMMSGRASDAPTIDGADSDGAWGYSISQMADRGQTASERPVSTDDLSVSWKSTWDDANLYFFFNVTDNDISRDSADETWQDDSLELAIDVGAGRTGGFDQVDDFKYIFVPNAEGGDPELIVPTFPAQPAGADDVSNFGVASVVSATGYTMEVSIPWATLGVTPEAGMEMAVEFQLNDDDNGGGNENRLGWSRMERLNNETDSFGYFYLIDYPETMAKPMTPTVDGTIEGAWASANWEPINRRAPFLSAGFSGQLALAWDSTNLYAAFELTDDMRVSDSEADYLDDSIEFVVDGDLSRGGGYDKVNDFKWTFRPMDDGSVEIIAPGFPGNPPGSDLTGIEAAYTETDSGWIMEMQVPLAKFGVAAEGGSQFGFDVQINDDDDGGDTREEYYGWSSLSGVNNRTNLYGYVTLEGTVDNPFAAKIGASSAGGNMYSSNWFGQFETIEDSDWILHSLGWLWTGTAVDSPNDNLWLWSHKLDMWVLTSASMYPALWTPGGYYYHFYVESVGSWIYDYEAEAWMNLND